MDGCEACVLGRRYVASTRWVNITMVVCEACVALVVALDVLRKFESLWMVAKLVSLERQYVASKRWVNITTLRPGGMGLRSLCRFGCCEACVALVVREACVALEC